MFNKTKVKECQIIKNVIELYIVWLCHLTISYEYYFGGIINNMICHLVFNFRWTFLVLKIPRNSSAYLISIQTFVSIQSDDSKLKNSYLWKRFDGDHLVLLDFDDIFPLILLMFWFHIPHHANIFFDYVIWHYWD